MNGGRDVVAVGAPVESSAVGTGRNVVVAIGIDRYRHRSWPALRNAVSDAVGAAQAFQELGFEEVVPPLHDELATRDAIDVLVTDVLDRKLCPEDSLVVFYAGHGGVRLQTPGVHQVTTGHLIPVDASDQYASWIELRPWLEKIARLPPKHILVILDACKSGIALSDALWRTRDSATVIARPYAAASAKQSRLLITSASEGEVALDSGPRPGHSLFTGCLIDALIGGEAPYFVHDGRPLTIGSNLGHHVRDLVQAYPAERGGSQTPVVGRFLLDNQGEMLIPALGGETTGSRRVFAEGSNELRVTASEPAPSAVEAAAGDASAQIPIEAVDASAPSAHEAVGEAGDAVGAPTVDARRRGSRRWISMIAALVALVVAAFGAAAWRLRSQDPSPAGTDTVARGEPADPQVSVLMPVEGADAAVGAMPGEITDAAVGATLGAGSAEGSAGSGHAAGVARTKQHSPGNEPARPPVGAPVRPAVAMAPAGAALRQVRTVARAADGQPALCPFHYDGPKGATVEWNHAITPFPADLMLPCGVEEKLLVSQEHRVSAIRKMTATLTHSSDRVRSLKKITVKVTVTSKPTGAMIYQGKKILGVTPTTVDLAESELVVLTVSKSGFASDERRITPGVDRKVFAELTRRAP